MSIRFLKEFTEKRKAEFYANVRKKFAKMAERDEPITWEEYQQIRANSYERRLLHRNLDLDALLRLIKQFQENTKRELMEYEIPTDYDDALQRELLPLLVKKVEESMPERVETDCELVDCQNYKPVVCKTRHICAKGYKVSIIGCYEQSDKKEKENE